MSEQNGQPLDNQRAQDNPAMSQRTGNAGTPPPMATPVNMQQDYHQQVPPQGTYYQPPQPPPPNMSGYYQIPPQQPPQQPHTTYHRVGPVVCPYAGKRSHGWLWGFLIAVLIFFILLPILAIVGLCALGACIGSFVDTQIGEVSTSLGGSELTAKGDLTRRVIVKTDSKREIAVVDVKGIIMRGRGATGIASAGDLCKIFRELKKNKNVEAIVLDMDSPGGEIVATDEIHKAMQDCRASGKKIVTCMHSLGASGGYYLAAGGDWIVANRMTMTGSVGVIMSSYNISGLAEKIGVKPVVFKSGNMKDMMSMTRDMTDAEKTYLQKHIDESFGEFAKIEAAGRPAYADENAVRKAEFADGRVVSGARALELGLIDELGGMEEALAKAREFANAEKPCVVRYGVRSRFWDTLIEMRSTDNPLMKAAAVQLQPGRLYYLAPGVLGL